ncbi:MAG TPA: hypothetical protein VFZ53_13365 [Polyangiaceae bacterium]
MTTSKTIDRKTFLASTVAAISTVTLGACSSDSGDDGGGGETGGTSTGGTATGGTATGGTATGGTATGGSAGSGMTGGASGSASGGTAGSGGSGGGTFMCTTNTTNGDHAHPLTVPSSDVERGFQDAPYTLEDGGTGHTHTVELTAYEFLYLSGGMTVTTDSTTDAGHLHPCVITCAPG